MRIVLFALLLSACAPPPPTAFDACVFFSYLHPAPEDTMETQRQILNHNIAYQKLCGGLNAAP